MVGLVFVLATCSPAPQAICSSKAFYEIIARGTPRDHGCQTDLTIRNLRAEKAGLHRLSLMLRERPTLVSLPPGWSCEVAGNDDTRRYVVECVAEEKQGYRAGAILGGRELAGLSFLLKSGQKLQAFCAAVLFQDGAGEIGGVIGH